jgi:hypothetical protein
MASLTVDTARDAGSSDEPGTARSYFVVSCGWLVILNLLTVLYHLSATPVFNVMSNAVGIFLIAYSLLTVLRSETDDTAGKRFLRLAAIATGLSFIANLTHASLTDSLKYLSLYIFYAAGRSCRAPFRPVELFCLYALGALPIVFLLVGSSKVYDDASFAYLPNANTAVLYFSAILFAASHVYGNLVILLQLLSAALMNKIGPVVATVIAIGLWVAVPLRRESIMAAGVVGVAGAVAFKYGAFDRAVSVFDDLWYVFRIEPSSLASLTYRELVELTRTTDLSAFFRIIHWSNIWDVYSRGGIVVWLFGYGAGQTGPLTYAGLVPHNDYLRILAEYGIFNLTIFVCFLVHIWRALTSGAGKVLFSVLCIYFFSENLLDNFTSMALFFAYAGRLAATEGKHVGQSSQRIDIIELGGAKQSSHGRSPSRAALETGEEP